MTMTAPLSHPRRRIRALFLAACCLAGGVAPPAPAAPTLPQVVAGQASFSQQGKVFSITNTPGAIINWQSFDVQAGETARFIQQSADSAVLNRVLGQDPTRILGALQSNGKVFLINPNGILFGQGARVDVNGLVASTLDIADADFKAGRMRFQAGAGVGNSAGTVRNDGAIATPAGGRVLLLAPSVENNGIVEAPNGEIVLAAGRSVQLADADDPELHVVISAPGDHALNLGQVLAQGGRIGVYGALVEQRGAVSADSAVRGADGSIVLKSSGATRLGAGSVTSAVSSTGKGGAIRVLGAQVGIEAGAGIDASGAGGGGTVLVGGDWQGAAGTPRAAQVDMAAGASIRADATRAGDGGKVVLWSSGTTTAHGGISAHGAGNSGNGGQVETSGHVLDVDGIAVDARAGGGGARNGSWLLDPYDIEVVAGGDASAGDVRTASGGAASGLTRIAPATLGAAGADVVLQAQHDLTVSDAIDASGNVQAQAGHDIAVNARVSAGGDLDFRAGNAFTLGASGLLETANNIDIRANGVALAGGIAGAGGQDPLLSLSSTDPARAIVVGSGTPDAGALWLDAATLGRLSASLYEINLGNSLHTGPVRIAAGASLAASSNLVLEGADTISLDGAVDLTANPDSRFIASLYGGANGLIAVNAPLRASSSVLLQGDRLAIAAPLSAASVGLMPNDAGVAISVGGANSGNGFSLGQAALAQVNAGALSIGGLSGGYGGLSVAGALDLSAAGGPARLVLDAGAGALTVTAPLAVGGTLALSALQVAESGGGRITAPALALRSGSVTLPGANAIGVLAASGGADAGVFQVSNAGQLTIGGADGLSGIAAGGAVLQIDAGGRLQLDAGITGASAADLGAAGIAGAGVVQAATLALRSSAGIGSAAAPLRTQAGSILAYNQDSGSQPINIANQGTLMLLGAVQDGAANRGAITIDNVGGMSIPAYAGIDGAGTGEVRTSSGDISLATHSPMDILGHVATASGNVRLLADNGGKLTIGPGASVSSGTGSIDITAGSTVIASGTVQVSSPDKLHVTDTTMPPSQPSQPPPPPPPPPPPTVTACLANHGVAGCADVLAKALQTCVLNPDGPLCGQLLPTVAACLAAPSSIGCSVVLARNEIDQCLANPALPGCTTKIPSYDACKAAPSNYGCTEVIARHDAITSCIATPGAAGCASVLPALAVCRVDGSVYGCAAVLQLAFQACLGNPHDASCSGILPTLGECVTAPAKSGCDAVLPTLSQCIGSPSLQGCEVRLPTLARCAAAPSTAGCEAVLPTASFCSLHPGDASCVVFSGSGGSGGSDGGGAPVAQAVQGAVQLIDAGTSVVASLGGVQGGVRGGSQADEDGNWSGAGRLAGPVQAQQTGTNNAKHIAKSYCN